MKKIAQESLKHFIKTMNDPRITAIATGVTLLGGLTLVIPNPDTVSNYIDYCQGNAEAIRENTEAIRENTKAIEENTKAIEEANQLVKNEQEKTWYEKILKSIQINLEFNNELDTPLNDHTVGENKNVEGIQGDNPQRRMRR